MDMPPIRLEIFTLIPGVRFEECYPFRVVGEIDGIEVSLINLADLKKNKKVSDRNKDLADLDNLP